MKKNVLLLLLLFFISSLFAQIHEQQTQHFEKFLQVEKIASREVKISLLIKPYTSKKKFVELLEIDYCKSDTSSKILFTDESNSEMKMIRVDTNQFVSIHLIFSKRVSSKKCQKIINDFQIIMKRCLMNWQDFPISNQSIYYIGHRGGVITHFQENTNDVIWAGKTLGISYVEVDVLLSHDNIPFLGHDWKYMSDQTKIIQENDSIDVSRAYYHDEQKVMFLSSLLQKHEFIILDLVHNSLEDQKKIINYLYKHFSKNILSTIYLQIDRFVMYKYIQSINTEILISYNYRDKNTNRWKPNWINQMKPFFDEIDMFVINPSKKVTSNLLKQFGGNAHKIIPVIQRNNVTEVKRVVSLGFKFVMIDDVMIMTNRLLKKNVISFENLVK